MNKALILSVLLGVSALAGILYSQGQTTNQSFLSTTKDFKYTNQFKRFQIKFNKNYGHDEVFYRYTFYAKNMDIIQAQNAKFDSGNSTYFLGENHLTDLALDEFKQKLLGYKRNTPKKIRSSKQQKSTVSIPDSVDWTQVANIVSPIKNQGQCGACWAFSAAGALESLNAIQNKVPVVQFSEQAINDCSSSYGNQGCNGGLMDQAFQYTEASGVATEASYPYTAEDGTCQSFTSVFQNSGYKDVDINSDSALITAIVQQPVSVAIEADTSVFQLYAGGILDSSACGTQLDHGVIAVGYASGYYKIRNSWGEDWGEQGYVRLARTGDGAGICGVLSDPSYPTL